MISNRRGSQCWQMDQSNNISFKGCSRSSIWYSSVFGGFYRMFSWWGRIWILKYLHKICAGWPLGAYRLILKTIYILVLHLLTKDQFVGDLTVTIPQFYAGLFDMFIPSYKTTDLAHCWSDGRAKSFVLRKFYCSCFTKNIYYHVDYEVFFWTRGIGTGNIWSQGGIP